MVRVIVYCEGLTEEMFINEVLTEYLARKHIYLKASQCGSGGVSKYSAIKRDVRNWCRQDRGIYVTTMLDYYAIPSDVPGFDDSRSDLCDRISHIEKCMYDDLGESNFIPNLIVHEFETLLFSDISAFEDITSESRIKKELESIYTSFESPEHINGSYDTSPSHRIKMLIPGYSKPFNGKQIAKKIGIDKMRSECKHFDKWIKKMEELNM